MHFNHYQIFCCKIQRHSLLISVTDQKGICMKVVNIHNIKASQENLIRDRVFHEILYMVYNRI